MCPIWATLTQMVRLPDRTRFVVCSRQSRSAIPRYEKLLRFLVSLILREFYGKVTVRFEAGKVTHVETETRQTWRYGDLPNEMSLVQFAQGLWTSAEHYLGAFVIHPHDLTRCL